MNTFKIVIEGLERSVDACNKLANEDKLNRDYYKGKSEAYSRALRLITDLKNEIFGDKK